MGEYRAYFASSDAMILDSVSFMAEYLYVHKPALFLTREGERFNEFGETSLPSSIVWQERTTLLSSTSLTCCWKAIR